MSTVIKKYYSLILYSLILILGIEILCLDNFKVNDNYEMMVMINKEADILNILNNMSLEEKIGQLLVISNNSNSFDENTKELLEKIKPGGFIMMGPNFSSYEDTKNYIKELKYL